jgi:gliding motility-associated-like protein
MKIFIFFLFLSLTHLTYIFGQNIVAPDTVCVGVPANFTLDSAGNFASFAWEFGTNSLTPILTTSVAIPGTPTNSTQFSVVAQTTMIYDTSNNSYHAFITSASSGYTNPTVQRLDFGTNPNSIPVATDLGNPNNAFITPANSNLEAVEIVLDATGVFHAFFTNRGLVHWVFGNGLTSPPTQATRIFDNPSVMGMGMQMSVMKVNGTWIIFAGQSYGINNVLRFDLGTNLNNIPSPLPYVILPQPIGGLSQFPCYFSILKEAGAWYMFVAPLGNNAPLLKYNFGSDIQNNNPIVSNLGATSPPLQDNRGLNFVKSCDSFYMLGLNQDGTILSFNFQNNINNVPTAQSIGQVYGPNVNMQVLKPYWYNDTLWALSGNWNNNNIATVFRFPLLSIPSGNAEIKYYDPTTTHTFNAPGIYNITLYCDQADPRGPQAFCKQIVVIDSISQFLGMDTSLCSGDELILSVGNLPATGYLWNTGDTTSSIAVNQSGTYWVHVSGSSCIEGTDSIHVAFNPIPEVKIQPHDTAICQGVSITLLGSGASQYQWSPADFLDQPNAAQTRAQPPYTITYILSGKDASTGCEGKDSILITVNPQPDIKVTSDSGSVNCNQPFVQLHASGGVSYIWQPGSLCDDSISANPLVRPDGSRTIFYVTGRDAIGCEGIDSISIISLEQPIFFVPNAFSPNGDDLNDVFLADIYCDFELKSLNVYNRWGQLVFRSSNVDEGWDGLYKHKPADLGTYFWYIIGKTNDGKIVKKKGDVLLIR